MSQSPTPVELSDAGLLERSAGGDREAFERVVLRHSASVYRLARVLVSDDEAEDVLQQTFLAAWTHAGRFRAEASVRTWLLTIARHAALRLRQRRAHEPLAAVSLDDLGVQAGWGARDPETLAIASERQGLLEAAFASLTPEEREVITLRDLEGPVRRRHGGGARADGGGDEESAASCTAGAGRAGEKRGVECDQASVK